MLFILVVKATTKKLIEAQGIFSRATRILLLEKAEWVTALSSQTIKQRQQQRRQKYHLIFINISFVF